ncbi:hypothetical protein [Microbispora sp. NBRC 16548]|uniref:hypothetical protein n=1 Tax=Microbispora sp. NBRC 16548 TaxID=3030994 RepID=UPI00161F04DA|nr:hypothetical protein [Microbispora sp. NBRC 16548]GLX07800.1 hypothetical protein Misp03_47260 [Microbispora sp. NBRC 16548]
MRPRWGNRVGLLLVGLALVAGGFGLLTAARGRPGAALIDASVAEGKPWALPLLAGAAMVLALVATRWLFMALGWGRVGSRTGAGIAMLGVALKGIDGIGHISVRLVRDGRLRVSVSLRRSADLRQVIRRLDESAVSRVRRAVGRDDALAVVRLHVRRR